MNTSTNNYLFEPIDIQTMATQDPRYGIEEYTEDKELALMEEYFDADLGDYVEFNKCPKCKSVIKNTLQVCTKCNKPYGGAK